jgi:hypothetical protein
LNVALIGLVIVLVVLGFIFTGRGSKQAPLGRAPNPTQTPRDALHYAFAHRILPSVLHRMPPDALGRVVSGDLDADQTNAPIQAIWTSLAEQVKAEPEPRPRASVARVGERGALLITMPEPRGPTHAFFTVAVPTETGLRYFALELCAIMDGSTVLGAWTADGTHHNYGAGPAPSASAFLAAVDRLISSS